MKRVLSLILIATLILSLLIQSVYATRFDAFDKYQFEDLNLVKNQGDYDILESDSFSGGKAFLLKATTVGDYALFNVNVKQRGLYNIKIGVRKGPDCGILRLTFPDINHKVGEIQNLYSVEYNTSEVDLGNQYLNIATNREYKINVVGKSEKSSGYQLTIDYILLTFVEEYKAIGATIPYDVEEPQPETKDSIYVWDQVVQGGTGCSTHIVFHPKEQGIAYMGTDMGGAYRWENDTKTWTPITDWLKSSEKKYSGIDGIALDYNNPDVIYLAAGTYATRTADQVGDVLKSTDKGKTWSFTGLNHFFGSNENYRAFGECIAVDPANSNIIMVATSDDGLYKSIDGAVTWQKANSPGEFVKNKVFPRIIVFDEGTEVNGVTQRIYCGVIGRGIYVSNDAGNSWTIIPNSPKNPVRVEMSDDDTIAVGTTDVGLLKYKNGEWSNISPMQGGQFRQVAIDKTNSNYMVTSYHWGPEGSFGQNTYMTIDGGKSWVLLNDTMIRNHTVPRVEWGGFFANVSDIAIDPFNPKRVFMVGWQNFYQTDDIFAKQTVWTNHIRGVEQGVNCQIITMPVGARLMTSDYDFGGMRHTDVIQYPDEMLFPKTNPSRISFMESDPNFIVRAAKGVGCYSTDNGISWRYFASFPVEDSDVIASAVSANVNPHTGLPVIVLLPFKDVPYISYDLGITWIESKGTVPNSVSSKWNASHYLVADKVERNTMYYHVDNALYRSEDYGANWNLVTNLGTMGTIKTAPNMSGEVWFAGGNNGLFRSSNRGETFYKIDEFDRCSKIGFGKEEQGKSNPTVYVWGICNGKIGIFRSVDMGRNWVQIYDEDKAVNKISSIQELEGDRQTFGVVYYGTNGRGVHYGVPVGQNPFYKNAYDEIRVIINNQPVSFDVSPILKNGRVMVPMRQIFEVSGAKVVWDEETKSILATRVLSDNYSIDKTVVKLTIGSNKISINGVESEMDVEANVINDRTLVPIRFVAQALGAKVIWDEKMNIVRITI